MEDFLTCRKCGEVKSLDAFVKSKENKNGRTSTCKVCRNKAKRAYYATHKDKIKEEGKRYRDKYQSVIRERKKQYYELNREKLLVKSRNNYNENKIDRLEWCKRYREGEKRPFILERKRKESKMKIKSLSDGYIIHLYQNQLGLDRDDIDMELIELKRKSLTLKRRKYEFRRKQKEISADK